LDVITIHTYRDPSRKEPPVIDFHTLAQNVDARGLAAAEGVVREITTTARNAGVSPVLVAVLADAREPEVARIRALAKIRMALESRRPGALAA
jgi:hypothetical protein